MWTGLISYMFCFQMVSELRDHLLRHLQGMEKKRIEHMALSYVSKLVGLAFSSPPFLVPLFIPPVPQAELSECDVLNPLVWFSHCFGALLPSHQSVCFCGEGNENNKQRALGFESGLLLTLT